MNKGGSTGVAYTFSPPKAADLEDLRADNIYLKGGSNMAEALLKKREPTPSSYDNQSAQQNSTILQSNYGSVGGSGSMSIAMRMKRNRDA